MNWNFPSDVESAEFFQACHSGDLATVQRMVDPQPGMVNLSDMQG
eukprot:CAMPEP_0172467550 /NCGR_PEP_ID=MMETSP1065-20121228/59260_1 /TAXON_ID=265537 /ORGANISM="Amphiprora paludosa, Strain CCMP125" /LENGTH=44 /DNA_ID= /DNA_START= /DNA_END= /DNA_ORIENTATION=